MYNVVIYDIEGGVHTLTGVVDDEVKHDMWWLLFEGGFRRFVMPRHQIAYANSYNYEDEIVGSTHEKAVELADLAER